MLGTTAVVERMRTFFRYFHEKEDIQQGDIMDFNTWRAEIAPMSDRAHRVDESSKMWTLMILDFTVAPPMEVLEQKVQAAASISHQDARNAVIVFFPKQHKARVEMMVHNFLGCRFRHLPGSLLTPCWKHCSMEYPSLTKSAATTNCNCDVLQRFCASAGNAPRFRSDVDVPHFGTDAVENQRVSVWTAHS